VKKDEGFTKQKLVEQLLKIEGLHNFKTIIFFNEGADLDDLFTLMWLLGETWNPIVMFWFLMQKMQNQ
jgi:hypothetical protein